MKIPIYQVDAFTSEVFKGNPAAVCPLSQWLSDEIMQKIAMENNLSETAFFIEDKDIFHIRWFTPKAELDLAGHPTLATAHVIMKENKNNLTAEITLPSKVISGVTLYYFLRACDMKGIEVDFEPGFNKALG